MVIHGAGPASNAAQWASKRYDTISRPRNRVSKTGGRWFNPCDRVRRNWCVQSLFHPSTPIPGRLHSARLRLLRPVRSSRLEVRRLHSARSIESRARTVPGPNRRRRKAQRPPFCPPDELVETWMTLLTWEGTCGSNKGRRCFG